MPSFILTFHESMPLGHVYCTKCLADHVNTPGSDDITSSCPTCRAVFNIGKLYIISDFLVFIYSQLPLMYVLFACFFAFFVLILDGSSPIYPKNTINMSFQAFDAYTLILPERLYYRKNLPRQRGEYENWKRNKTHS